MTAPLVPAACDCTCHHPDGDTWIGWCDDCTNHHADLTSVARAELVALWTDLARAVRQAANGRWSMLADELVDRIVALSRHVGAVPWVHVEIPLIRAGRYEGIHQQHGIPYPPVDWERLALAESAVAARRGGTL